MENFEQTTLLLSGKALVFARKLYGYTKIHGGIVVSSKTKRVFKVNNSNNNLNLIGSIGSEELDELCKNKILVKKYYKEGTQDEFYTLSKEYIKYIRKNYIFTTKQNELLDWYFHMKKENGDIVIAVDNDLSTGKYEYVLGKCRKNGVEILKTKGYNKRVVKALIKRGILVAVSNTGRPINSVENTKLLYSKGGEFFAGLKYLNEYGEIN